MTFNLRTLLVAVTMACVAVYLLIVARQLVATIGLLVYATLVTSFLVSGAIYARENVKAFCRGALVAMLPLFILLTYVCFMQFFSEELENFSALADGATRFLRRWSIGSTLLAALMGLATLGFKRLIEPRN